MFRILICLFLCLSVLQVNAQDEPPKLVVGIVVDQMRQDYLLRFRHNFGEEGFNRFLKEGFEFKNAHYNYIPTYTAPGHSAIYTGTTPAVNGIISNQWFDQQLNEQVYCAYDSTMSTVGSDNANGKMSPHQLLSYTITDQLRLRTQMRSKVVGISIKDRGAVFPAGHLGDAYWFDSETGNFITSSYYQEELPGWVNDLNNRGLADEYRKQTWSLALAPEKYTASGPDESPYEGGLMDKTTFPYQLSETSGYWIIPTTPFGNTIVTEGAKAAVTGENLGKQDDPDFLAISFSSTDYIGHNFGPNSMEVEDTYIRLDRELASLFAFLDDEVGAGEYVVFLTSDHGVADVPKRLMDLHVSAGYLRENLSGKINDFLDQKYEHTDWVRSVSNSQVFLNRDKISAAGFDLETVCKEVALQLLMIEGVSETYTFEDMVHTPFNAGGTSGALRRGFNQKRSGDVLYALEPNWLQSGSDTGTSHGTIYNYDTHVPVLWYGKNIPAGSTSRRYEITDITPTLAMILNLMLPDGSTGIPMTEVLSE